VNGVTATSARYSPISIHRSISRLAPGDDA